ncbi:hypothetical protein JVT61DRAFT_12070 [Boletus reticuloceps]|uniref:Uncharacterized protein n=1 Tax=Boletus reticuloceps TaxID=495285 RepID=A0A8I2YEN3_9AGAM|nr:hypothetical protein JVT61DRAFT_12070 [Boletus reticuloceps]
MLAFVNSTPTKGFFRDPSGVMKRPVSTNNHDCQTLNLNSLEDSCSLLRTNDLLRCLGLPPWAFLERQYSDLIQMENLLPMQESIPLLEEVMRKLHNAELQALEESGVGADWKMACQHTRDASSVLSAMEDLFFSASFDFRGLQGLYEQEELLFQLL